MGLRQQTPPALIPSLRPKQPQICFLSLGFWPFCMHGVTGVGPFVCGLRHAVLEFFWGVGGCSLLQRNFRPMLDKTAALTTSQIRTTRKFFSGKPDGAEAQRVRSDRVVRFAHIVSDYGVGEAGLSRGGENFQTQGPEEGGNLGSEESILLGSCPTPPHPFSLSPSFPPCCSQERTHQLHFHEGTANTTQCLPSQWRLTFNTALHSQRN